MPSRNFALIRGGRQRLLVTWEGPWKNLRVMFDGQLLGRFLTRHDLEQGQEFTLPDGTKLQVSLLNEKLHILHEGMPILGLEDDHHTKLIIAYVTIYIAAVYNIVWGLAFAFYDLTALARLADYWGIGIGILFLALAYHVANRSRAALQIAIAVQGLNLLTLVLNLLITGRINPISTVISVALLCGMYQGFQGVDMPEHRSPATPTTIRTADYNSANVPFMILEATRLLKVSGDTEEAVRLVTRVLQVDPNNPEAWYLQGYLAPSRNEKLGALEHVLSLCPDHQKAARALMQLKEGRDMAISDL